MSDHIEVDGKKYYEESYLQIGVATSKRRGEENKLLRKLLWLRHGCPFSALYGDDGEMQCARCRIDFKKESPTDIQEAFRRNNEVKL